MHYRVYIDANANHCDTSQRTLHGEFDSAGDAVAAAREIVRVRLLEEHRTGMKTEELLERYVQRGECPFILPEDEDTGFSVEDWAQECAARLCWRDAARREK
jgi:hypothetical protein